METPRQHEWVGLSGRTYRYDVRPISAHFAGRTPINYVFAEYRGSAEWKALCVGQTDDLSILRSHPELPCIRENGGAYVHVRVASRSLNERREEVRDLILCYNPPCNGKVHLRL